LQAELANALACPIDGGGAAQHGEAVFAQALVDGRPPGRSVFDGLAAERRQQALRRIVADDHAEPGGEHR
jgi:hypothetical protein